MTICKGCGAEITNGRELCKRCSQKNRLIKWALREWDDTKKDYKHIFGDRIIVNVFPGRYKEEDDIVIAS